MKRIICILIISLAFAIGNTECLASNNWTKIDIGTREYLQKVIIVGNKTLIFSNTNCYIGTNLSNWEKIDIPESRNICPVIFQGYIYINCKDGIYKSKSSDGKNWVKTASLSAMPITAITAISLAANNKKIFAFTGEQYHIAFESTDGINFNEIMDLQKIFFPNYAQGYSWGGCPWLGFAKAFGDTIYASGKTSEGSERNCYSFDNGITWKEDPNKYDVTTDMELGNYGLASTAIDHSGSYFIIHNYYVDLSMPRGVFLTLKTFNSCYYGGAISNGGLIVEGYGAGINISNIFYTPEQITRLEANQFYIIAIGSNGAVYVIKNDFTDYLLANSPTAISGIAKVGQEKIDIFPNPTSDILNIMATPGETIKVIDLNGKIVKSLLATEEKSVINVSDLNNSVYIVKSGNKVTKFIKK